MIPDSKPDKGSFRKRPDLVGQIRDLEEKVRALSDGGAKSDANSEGLAGGIVAALGRMVPGLESLIKVARQMPEFQQKLAAIDEEVKRKFREQPLGRASAGIAGNLAHRIGIPPSVRRATSGGHASAQTAQTRFTPKDTARGKSRQPRGPKVHISPQTPAKLPVDVFDEGSRIVVLAEAPGLEAKDIAVSLDGTVLLISIHAPNREGLQRVELPCHVTGEPQMSLSNGILNIQIRKANRQ